MGLSEERRILTRSKTLALARKRSRCPVGTVPAALGLYNSAWNFCPTIKLHCICWSYDSCWNIHPQTRMSWPYTLVEAPKLSVVEETVPSSPKVITRIGQVNILSILGPEQQSFHPGWAIFSPWVLAVRSFVWIETCSRQSCLPDCVQLGWSSERTVREIPHGRLLSLRSRNWLIGHDGKIAGHYDRSEELRIVSNT